MEILWGVDLSLLCGLSASSPLWWGLCVCGRCEPACADGCAGGVRWHVGGWWMARGWRVDGVWMAGGWHVGGVWVDGTWMAYGWWVDGVWMARGWHVGGVWMAGGWRVDGVWVACGWRAGTGVCGRRVLLSLKHVLEARPTVAQDR